MQKNKLCSILYRTKTTNQCVFMTLVQHFFSLTAHKRDRKVIVVYKLLRLPVTCELLLDLMT